MEQPDEHPQASGMYKPCLQEEEGQSLGASDRPMELMNIDQCASIRDVKDSQLVGVPVTLARDVDVAEREDGCLPNMEEVNIEVKVTDGIAGKRKRGRPARGLPKTPPLRKQRDEEDVCFICFDGGSLVLCDRRGCPKAYHPACIKRDESFFRSKAKWNCGWHICSFCQKASHYMCYTCTYSLCKGCTKDADYVCVRGNKGLCGICMRTIMLIENSALGIEEKCEVDFDDKTSWEYLFKVYWIYLKGKLSLTLDELLRAKNPWKGSAAVGCKVESPHELHLKDGKGSVSENSCIDRESNNVKNKKFKRQPTLLNKKDCIDRKTSCSELGVSLSECTKWASKELLEFIAHVRNGDTSFLSQFDVQALLLEYVKKNSLHDPQQKCQIVCDSRLVNLFGRARMGHFEMLKLLESHFLIKDDASAENSVRTGIINSVASQAEAFNNYNNQLNLANDKRQKTHKKADVQVPQNNQDAYAAINSHNINLVYLGRNLMENLIEDVEKFHDKVVGSIVRIRISSSNQNQEMHRLVQVVGTSKVSEPYRIGKSTTDIALEILNLNKKEVVSIDEISDQEFSEEECKHLRESIKFGFSKRLTVGEILDKALTLQAVRINHLLEAEILRLNHLHDRASEKGHRKELRECVEKLQLLNSPEERLRRLHETLEVHTDPSMDDSEKSDEKKQDGNIRSNEYGFHNRRQGETISLKSVSEELNDVGRKAQDLLATTHEQIGNTCTIKNQINSNDAAVCGSGIVQVVRSEACGAALDISSLPLSTGVELPFNNFATAKLWLYPDPTGKVQGPFSMLQLYKWNASGHFPSDLRIWGINEQQDDSILLTDALNGKCSKNMSLSDSPLLSLGDNSHVGGRNEIHSDSGNIEQSWKQKMDDYSTQSNCKDESVRSNGWYSHSSSWSIPADCNHNEGQSGNFERREESTKCENSCDDQPHFWPPLSSTIFSEKLNENLTDKQMEDHGIQGISDEYNRNHESNRSSEGQSDTGQSYQKQSDSEENSGQSSGQNWRHPHVNSSSNRLVATSAHVSSNVPVQDAGPSWSTTSSLVGGGTPHPEATVEWRCSTAPRNPSVEEWESNPVSASSLKPTETVGDRAATPSSMSGQLTHSSPSHPVGNTESTWQAIIGEPDDFNSQLVDKSVSDLLAEVEAMESFGGLESPTSIMKYGEELTEGSKTDRLSSAEVLSPMLDAGKGDALSSTGDLQLPSHSTAAEEPLHQADLDHHQRLSGRHPSRNSEVEVSTKSGNVLGNQWESGSEIPPTVPSPVTWDMATDAAWTARSESTSSGWEASKGNANMGCGVGQGTVQENRRINSYNYTGTPNFWGSQTRYGSDRFSVPRDRNFHGHVSGRDSGFGRGRTTWNRQPLHGVGNGPYRPPPKGQRICKFYESGYCKKGASCDYLHP